MVAPAHARAPAHKRSALLAFALALACPGLGHLYVGSVGGAGASLLFVHAAYIVPLGFLATGGSLLVMLIVWGVTGAALWALQGAHAARLCRRRPQRQSVRLWSYGALAAVALAGNHVLVVWFEARVLASYLPTSESMLPTLAPGDRYLVSKLLPRDTKPRRGDVIVFRAPTGADEDWVKRVVGLPGDHLVIDEDVVVVNGAPARYGACGPGDAARLAKLAPAATCLLEMLPGRPPHPIAREAGLHPRRGRLELVVPAGTLFVLGDNRDRSIDSRFLGVISNRSLIGRAHTVWRRADPTVRFSDVGRVP